MVDFKKALAAANKDWKKAKKRVAEEGPGGFADIPDGTYTARLVGAKIGQSESSKRLQVDFDWKIADGEEEGKHKHNYQGLTTEDNLFYLGRDLERLGYEMPDDLEDLPEILADMEKSKPVASIRLRTKGDFQNVYIRKVYASDESDEDVDDAEETEETEEEVEETDDAAEESEEEESDDAEESDDDDAEEEAEEESEEESDEDESDEESEEEESEEESGDDEDETIEIETGMRVLVETSKGREAGAIIEILEKEEKVRVKLDNDKVVRVGLDKIEVEPDEPKRKAKKEEKKPAKKTPPPPAKKSGKKSAPAPKKKGRK